MLVNHNKMEREILGVGRDSRRDGGDLNISTVTGGIGGPFLTTALGPRYP